MTSHFVTDSKLLVNFIDNRTHHVVFESNDRFGQQVRRQRTEQVWVKDKHIGEGGFGKVWLERLLTADGQPTSTKLRAVKTIPKRKSSSAAIYYKRELEAIARFSHESYNGLFVRSSGWYEDPNNVYIAMEYFELGDLEKHLDHKLPEQEAKEITWQLLDGLGALHQKGYAHRDLKPPNIFVVRAGPNWWVKIGDFGISKCVHDDDTFLRTAFFSLGYTAPEMLNNKSDNEYTNKVDMWSLGVLIHYMLTSTCPFNGSRELERYTQDSCFPSSALVACAVSKECQDFIAKGLMTPEAASRLSTSEAFEHEWLRGFDPSDINNQANKANRTRSGLASEQRIGQDTESNYRKQSASLNATDASASWSSSNGTEPEPRTSVSYQTQTMKKGETRDSSQAATPQIVYSPEQAAVIDRKELINIYKRGQSFFGLNQFQEAEAMFRRALKGQETVLGPGHTETLFSAQWLGESLHQQEKYKEAENLFRRALQGQEKELGYENEETLVSVSSLGESLYQQHRYKEAEVMFRRAVTGREKALGKEHIDTLISAASIGESLYQQQQYIPAEEMFRRALRGQEKELGQEHQQTLVSMSSLGASLYQQERYKEAEAMFQRALQLRENELGHKHEETLTSAYWAKKAHILSQASSSKERKSASNQNTQYGQQR